MEPKTLLERLIYAAVLGATAAWMQGNVNDESDRAGQFEAAALAVIRGAQAGCPPCACEESE